MDKSYIEKTIEKIAKRKLQAEFTSFCNDIKRSPFIDGLKIKEQFFHSEKGVIPWSTDPHYFVTHVLDGKEPKDLNSNIADLIRKRYEKLIEIETEKIFENLNAIQYLFNENQNG